MSFIQSLILPAIGHYEDTVALETNNIKSRNYWFFNNGNILHTVYNYSYSSELNPLYNITPINVILWELRGKDLDFISRNLYSSWNANGTFVNNATWISESGQVVSGTAFFTSAGVVHQVNTHFRYKSL